MVKNLKRLAALAALTFLGACGSSPGARYFTLEEGLRPAGQQTRPSVLIVAASVPEGLDRPQLVLRGAANQIVMSDAQRWAEPLRSSIPRVVAADLGHLLDSSGVAAVPAGAPYFDADFRLTLHLQRLDVQPGRGVDLDLVWVLKPRQGKEILGHSQIVEPDAGETDRPADLSRLVSAQRRALGRAASEIAAEIRRQAAVK